MVLSALSQLTQLTGMRANGQKSDNILLDGEGQVKIADVGMARVFSGSYITQVSSTGTFAWCVTCSCIISAKYTVALLLAMCTRNSLAVLVATRCCAQIVCVAWRINCLVISYFTMAVVINPSSSYLACAYSDVPA